MQNLIERRRRSELMDKELKSAFKKYVAGFPTKTDAAIALGVSRVTLNGLISRGSGKPETIQAIREKLAA
jgi:hypothetical protein